MSNETPGAEVMRAMAESAPMGLALFRAPDGALVYANPALRRLLGDEPGAVLAAGSCGAGVLRAGDGTPYPFAALPHVRTLGSGRSSMVADVAFRRADGREVPLIMEAWPVGADVDGVARVALVVRDVSRDGIASSEGREQLAALMRHAALADELRFVLDNMSDFVYRHDARGVFYYTSPGVERITGYSADEWCQHYTTFLTDHPMNRRAVELTEQALATGTPMGPYRVEVRRRDGRRITLEVNERPFFEDGAVAGIIGVARDVTEQMRTEDELLRLNRRLREQKRELENVIDVASHDLRTPLVSIVGFAAELESTIDEALAGAGEALEREAPELLRRLVRNVRRLDELLGGLLRLSRLGRTELRRERVDVAALVRAIADDQSFQIRATGASLSFGELPPCLGDPLLLSQVFANLVANAIKYRDAHRPLQVRIEGAQADAEVVYRVRDNGIGIEPDQRSRVFDPFRRLDPRRSEGEGLGLTIVQRIVERHDGEVTVESTPGEGTTFVVRLPASPD